MTLKEMEIAIKNLQNDVKNIAGRNFTGKSEEAKTEALKSKAAANVASAKADSYDEKITTLSLAQEELFTEILPDILESEV